MDEVAMTEELVVAKVIECLDRGDLDEARNRLIDFLAERFIYYEDGE